MSMVPDYQSMFQTKILKKFPLLLLYSAGPAHRASVFTWTTMVGMFNTFGVRYMLNISMKILSHIDSSCHVDSPCDLYGHHFSGLSKKIFDKCTHIQERTFQILNRVSAGQLKTNLVRIDMEPGMWWMLVLHMRKASKLAIPSHPVYYSYLKTTSIHCSTETTRSKVLQCVTDVSPNREVSVRCYTREHIHMLQKNVGICLELDQGRSCQVEKTKIMFLSQFVKGHE
jgi:hypothetical protein